MKLVFPGLVFGIEISGKGRTAKENRLGQDVLDRAVEARGLLSCEPRAEPRRMNLRAPKTLVGINVPEAAQNALIQQQRLDSRAPFADARREFRLREFERICAERRKSFF